MAGKPIIRGSGWKLVQLGARFSWHRETDVDVSSDTDPKGAQAFDLRSLGLMDKRCLCANVHYARGR
jgi:hypothetical protein